MQSRFEELAETVNKRLEENTMFEINQEFEALNFLVERGIITSSEYWEKALETTYNLDHLIIKFANYVKQHDGK